MPKDSVNDPLGGPVAPDVQLMGKCFCWSSSPGEEGAEAGGRLHSRSFWLP